PYFYLTDNWIVNYESFPHNFLLKVEDIERLEGMTYNTGYTYNNFFVASAKADRQMVIPLYTLKDHKKFAAHIANKNPSAALTSSDFTRLYFQRVFKVIP